MEAKILEQKTYEIDKVKEEDKNLVQDVLSVLERFHKSCKSWIVNLHKGYYEVVATIEPDKDGGWEIFMDDFELIRQLDTFRIPSVSLGVCAGVPQMKIRIIPRSERVVIHTTDILRVEKKRKWWFV